MKHLVLTLPTPAENLALDEALLDAAEANPRFDAAEAGLRSDEVLRLWEPNESFVVLGRSSRVDTEVDRAACRRRGVPILRRSSGGAAVVAGPGCLMYAVVLSYARRPELRLIDRAHRYVLSLVGDGLAQFGLAVKHCGTSDLALADRKVSGNSMRCKRNYLLYHGTLLHDFDLALVGELLRPPPRQPEYRAGRTHADFLANLPIAVANLRGMLIRTFEAETALADWPRERVEQLVAQRYGSAEWTERH